MRKNVFGRQLGRTKNQRRALFRGLILSLVENGELTTTLSKARSIKAQAEKLITKAKSGQLNDRRIIFKFLNKKSAVNRLVDEIAPIFKERKGGYLRIIRVGIQRGDGSEQAKVLFTEEVKKREPKKDPSFAKATEGKGKKVKVQEAKSARAKKGQIDQTN